MKITSQSFTDNGAIPAEFAFCALAVEARALGLPLGQVESMRPVGALA